MAGGADGTAGGGECPGAIADSLRNGAPDSAAYCRDVSRFDVFMVPHESSVFAGDAGRQLLGDGPGIVGITCVPNLLAGGCKALRLGLPPQCVLLDHCGCRKHWHDEGISTEIDMAELRRVLDLD